jgi:hypothetical protein
VGMADFHAVLLEGLFFLSEDPYPDSRGQTDPSFKDLLVHTPTGVKSVFATLRPLVNEQVYFSTHHVPSDPIDPSRWGGGACLWQPAAMCPFGHHKNPSSLFNLTAQGFLVFDLDHTTKTGGWWVIGPDGSKTILPLTAFLPGHTGRVAAATVMAAERMRDAALAAGMDVESLGQRVTDLRDLVADLSRVVKKGD